MSTTNINALNGISNSFDPWGMMRFYDNPSKKKGKSKMAKPQGKEMANGNKTIPKTPNTKTKGGGTKGPKKGGGKGPNTLK